MTRPAPDWFADDAFWAAMYPFLFSEAARAGALTDVAAIRSLVGRPMTTILDLCCGPGRHSVPLARLGGRVTGVDRSPYLLDRARHYAREEGVDVRWVLQDMRDFIEPGGFDCALSLFTSFGFFEDPADNRRVLANVHASLVPGGVFVLDLAGKEVAARLYQPCGTQDLPDGSVLVQRRKTIDDWARMENDWSILRNGQVQSFRFRHWLYSAVELRELLGSVGFVDIDAFGSLAGSPYDEGASRLVMRAYR